MQALGKHLYNNYVTTTQTLQKHYKNTTQTLHEHYKNTTRTLHKPNKIQKITIQSLCNFKN